MNDRIRELLVESGFCFWADEAQLDRLEELLK